MPHKKPWIDRKFLFDLPISMFPNILERLRGTPVRLAERVHGLPQDLLRQQPGGSWSILQIIGHFSQVEKLWILRLDDFDAGLKALRPADMTNRATEDANYNEAGLEALLTGFRQVRSQFVGRLEAMSDKEIARSAHHPRLNQPMRVLDLMVFAAEHDDHHLARLSELLRILGK